MGWEKGGNSLDPNALGAKRPSSWVIRVQIAVFACVLSVDLGAATTIWTGLALNDNWSDGLNWDNGVPGAADDVVIDNDIFMNSNALLNVTSSIRSLTVNALDSLTQLNDRDLTVSTVGVHNDGTITLESTGSTTQITFSGTNTLSGSGTLVMSDNVNNRIRVGVTLGNYN